MTDALVFSLTGAETERNNIPSAVPMENLTPETQEATGGAPELMEVAAEGAAATTGGEEAATLPEPALPALEVVVRSPEIQDSEPIRSAPKPPPVVVAGSSCWRTTWWTRQRWLGIWRRSARPSSG
jgi:hypothetical protein